LDPANKREANTAACAENKSLARKKKAITPATPQIPEGILKDPELKPDIFENAIP